MQGIVRDIAVGVVANLAFVISIIIFNKFTARAVDVQTELLRKDWVGRFAISAFINMLSYLLFTYIFAVVHKQFGMLMGEVQVYGVIMVGICAPLVNFITFMFLNPQKWGESIAVGVTSLFIVWGYMALIATLYQIAFRFMERLPGA